MMNINIHYRVVSATINLLNIKKHLIRSLAIYCMPTWAILFTRNVYEASFMLAYLIKVELFSEF